MRPAAYLRPRRDAAARTVLTGAAPAPRRNRCPALAGARAGRLDEPTGTDIVDAAGCVLELRHPWCDIDLAAQNSSAAIRSSYLSWVEASRRFRKARRKGCSPFFRCFSMPILIRSRAGRRNEAA